MKDKIEKTRTARKANVGADNLAENSATENANT